MRRGFDTVSQRRCVCSKTNFADSELANITHHAGDPRVAANEGGCQVQLPKR